MKGGKYMAWCTIRTWRRDARSGTGQVRLRLWLTTQPRTSDLRVRARKRQPTLSSPSRLVQAAITS